MLTRSRRRATLSAWLLSACQLALPLTAARALDKQGSAHGGSISGESSGFALSGSLLGGAALYNPTYAARPDNSGHALLRVAPHFDIDLIGSRLSIPVDVNFFSDRSRSGIGKLAPSEMDVISGLTSTWPLGPTALEFGARFEGDFPVDGKGDEPGYHQTYGDARARLLYSLGALWPGLHDALAGGDIGGAVTLGCFAINETYAARPDNTGIALFRYAFHVNAQYTERFSIGLDATMFTDRRKNAVAPSELDFTVELGSNIVDSFALHLAYERDMPVDRGGKVQHFLLLFATWDFSLIENTSAAAAAAAAPESVPGTGSER